VQRPSSSKEKITAENGSSRCEICAGRVGRQQKVESVWCEKNLRVQKFSERKECSAGTAENPGEQSAEKREVNLRQKRNLYPETQRSSQNPGAGVQAGVYMQRCSAGRKRRDAESQRECRVREPPAGPRQ